MVKLLVQYASENNLSLNIDAKDKIYAKKRINTMKLCIPIKNIL